MAKAPQPQQAGDSHDRLLAECERLERENRALYHELGPLLALQDFTQRLDDPDPIATLVPIVLRSALSVLAGKTAALALVEANGPLTFAVAEGEEASALRGQAVPGRKGILPWVLDRRRSLAVGPEDSRVSPFERTFCPDGTIAATPLAAAGKRIGVLVVFAARHLDERQRSWLESVGAIVATSIAMAQLRGGLEREHERALANQEELRRKIARNLHDGPAQQLAGLTMNLEVIARLLPDQPEQAAAEFGAAIALAHRTTRELRTLLFELRPLILEAQGLIPALQSYVAQLKPDDVTFHLAASGSIDRLSPDVEAALFAVAQEAIANVRKHARARNCWLHLTRRGRQLTLTVQDDGRGFDVQTVERTYARLGSLGLISMRERIDLIGGTFAIQSIPDQGTTVTARLPLGASGTPTGEEHESKQSSRSDAAHLQDS